MGSEPADPTRRARAWRLASTGVLVLGGVVLVMLVALSLGMRLNDSAIDANLGTATATVLTVNPLRTGIEFVDAEGLTVRPPGGVLYPGLLSVGQQFIVEYSTADPTVARVAGRTGAVGALMIALAMAATVVVTMPVAWWLRRRSRLLIRRARPVAVLP